MTFAQLSDPMAITSAATTILAFVALIFSVRTYRESRRASRYESLDTMYFELLKTALERPHLRNPSAKRTSEQQEEYEIYAHMAWCVVETIHDRAASDGQLLDIWRSAIEIENRLHRSWFDRPGNEYKFRRTFRDYIEREFPPQSAVAVSPDGSE